MEVLAYIGIALLAGATGGYTLAATGLRFRLPITWNADTD